MTENHGPERQGRALYVLGLCVALFGCSAGPVRTVENAPTGIPLAPEQHRPRHERDIRSIVVSPSGNAIATVGAEAIHLWTLPDLVPLAIVGDIEQLEFARDIVLSDGGKRLAVINGYGALFVWDVERFSSLQLTTSPRRAPERLVGFLPDGSLLWVSAEEQLVRWEPGATRALEITQLSRAITATSSGPGGFLLYGGWVYHQVTWDEDKGVRAREIQPFWPNQYADTAPMMSPDGRYLFVVLEDEPLRIDLEDGHFEPFETGRIRVADGGSDGVSASAISPVGSLFAVGYRGGGIEIWNGESGERVAGVFVGEELVREVHPTRVLWLAFGAEELWVLLPEQRVVSYRIGTWERTEVFEL